MSNIIYGLIDPNTKEMRYIGKTNDLKRRMCAHYCPSHINKKSIKNSWLKSLLPQKVMAIVLEQHNTYEDLYDAEIELIAYFKYIGCNLTNGTPGGDGIPRGCKLPAFSDERKKKMSDIMRGKTWKWIDGEKIKVGANSITIDGKRIFLVKRYSSAYYQRNKKKLREQAKKYQQSEKGRAAMSRGRIKYRQTDKGKAAIKRSNIKQRQKVCIV